MQEETVGWMQHDHGGCPCVGEYVEAEYANGDRRSFRAKGGVGWTGGGIVHGDQGMNFLMPIVQYRIRSRDSANARIAA